jgi:hypothetical protein
VDDALRSELHPRAVNLAAVVSMLFVCAVAMATALISSHDALARRIDRISTRPAPTPAALDTKWSASHAEWDLDTAPRPEESDEAWIDRHISTFRSTRDKTKDQ